MVNAYIQYACVILASISFILSIVSAVFATCFDKDELMGKYGHWVRPLLFMGAVAWFSIVWAFLGAFAKIG